LTLATLVENAVKHGIAPAPEGGSIEVKARRVGDAVEVSVTDTGAGMDEEELGRLFEPFYTTKSGGTGLGLTIVSRLLEQNGGHVTVSSVKGEGSTFSMRLPLARGADAGSSG
jgi:signal transduction histidine kinase